MSRDDTTRPTADRLEADCPFRTDRCPKPRCNVPPPPPRWLRETPAWADGLALWAAFVGLTAWAYCAP